MEYRKSGIGEENCVVRFGSSFTFSFKSCSLFYSLHNIGVVWNSQLIIHRTSEVPNLIFNGTELIIVDRFLRPAIALSKIVTRW